MKKIGLLAFCSLISVGANASLLTGEIASDAYVTLGGYDLAWASPCSDGILENSCDAIDLDEQAGYGWSVMTSALFESLNITAATFLVDYTSDNTQDYNGDSYAQAAGWFTNSSHIDVYDGLDGNWSFTDTIEDTYYDTIMYRTSSVDVPEPFSALLLGFGLAGIGLSKRKKRVEQK